MSSKNVKNITLEELDQLIKQKKARSMKSSMIPDTESVYPEQSVIVPASINFSHSPAFPPEAEALMRLEQKSEFLSLELSTKTQKVAELESKLANLSKEHTVVQTKLESRIEQLEEDNKRLREHLSISSASLKDLSQRHSALQAQNRSIEAQFEEKLLRQKESFERKKSTQAFKLASESKQSDMKEQIAKGLGMKLSKAEKTIEETREFFKKYHGLVLLIEPPITKRKLYADYKRDYERLMSGKGASSSAMSLARFKSAEKMPPKTTQKMNTSQLSARSFVSNHSIASRGSRLSNRSRVSNRSNVSSSSKKSVTKQQIAIEKMIDRKEKDLNVLKQKYKHLLFQDEEDQMQDPLIREKANFFAREIQAMSKELLELRKKQRKMFTEEFMLQ